MFRKYAANLQGNTHAEVALQFYWSRTSVWVFSGKFATYFQNTFSQEHLWIAAPGNFYLNFVFQYMKKTKTNNKNKTKQKAKSTTLWVLD